MTYEKLPTSPKERDALIDVIRGVAIFGILLSNILIFSGFLFTPFSELKTLNLAEFNDILYSISKIVISGKFYPIFCILFGYGFYMQVKKYNHAGESFLRYFSRRLFFLLIIGLLHQIIWPGDVVTIYALVGFLFLFARNTSQRQDLFLAITFFGIYFCVGLIPYLFPPDGAAISQVAKQISHFSFPGVDNVQLIDKVRNGGISGMYFFYLPQYKFLWSFHRLSFVTHSVIGLFFMGGYLYKSDFFNKAALKIKNLILFFIIGSIGSILYANIAYPFRIIDNLFFSLFYMSIIAIIFKTGIGKKILQIFNPVGRMALTSYVLQSVLCIFIFYGIGGLSYFAKKPLYQVYLIAIGILVFESIFCTIWLKKFKFGPIEWLWRCLSYKKWLPLKIRD